EVDALASLLDLLERFLAGLPDLRQRLLDLVGALKSNALGNSGPGHSVCFQVLDIERRQLRRCLLRRALDVEAFGDSDARKPHIEWLALDARGSATTSSTRARFGE